MDLNPVGVSATTLPCFANLSTFRYASMSEEARTQNQPLSPLDEKVRLECEKLKAEIEAVRKPLHKTPSFYAAIAPVMLAVLGLIFTWSSGWFDVQRTRISNEKILLEADTSKLSVQKEALTTETSRLEASRISLNKQKTEEQQNVIALTNQLSQLQRQRDEKEDVIRTLNIQISKLTQENEQAQALVKQIDKLQSERDKAESQLFEIRSHLATAYERARNIVIEGGNTLKVGANVISHPETMSDYFSALSSWTFALGKWRAVYESDVAQFNLGQFLNSTNINTNVVSNLRGEK